VPWNEVAVDLVGPWHVKVQQKEYVFLALTCIDPVTGFAELVRIDDKTSAHVALKFENEWLARYPRPLRCIHDTGSEFIGPEFQHVLAMNGIHDSPTTTKNPQANAIVERLHRTVEDCLRTLLHAKPPPTGFDPKTLIDTALATTSFAIRAAVHTTMRASPGAVVFHRDMLLPLPLIVDLEVLRQRRQVLIDENLRRQNLRRDFHDYTIGEEVLILDRDPVRRKLDIFGTGPYTVYQIHTNGTVTILRSPGVWERINVRRLRPYVRATHEEAG